MIASASLCHAPQLHDIHTSLLHSRLDNQLRKKKEEPLPLPLRISILPLHPFVSRKAQSLLFAHFRLSSILFWWPTLLFLNSHPYQISPRSLRGMGIVLCPSPFQYNLMIFVRWWLFGWVGTNFNNNSQVVSCIFKQVSLPPPSDIG